MKRLLAFAIAVGVAFVALAWIGSATRGVIAEEAQPYLARHPIVLEWRERSIAAMPPYEDGAASRPRWVATSQWPVVAYDGRDRMWPVFLRGHQTALASYVGISLGPALGGGIAGVRRSTALLGLVIVLATGWAAWRGARSSAAWALAIVASSFGMLAIVRTGYGFEVGSRAAMMIAIALLAPRAPPRRGVLVAAACACAVAILSRATIAIALAPAVAYLLHRRDARPTRSQSAMFVSIAVVAPIALVALFAALAPFRAATAPLAGFDLAAVPSRMASAPRQLVLALAWLGDATSIFGPLARGERSLDRTLWLPAAIAAVPIVAAVVRWTRGLARDGERMLVLALACTVVGSAALYPGPDQFQLALALEPLIALAVAEQIASVPRAWIAAAIGGAALVVRAHGLWTGLSLDLANANPMLSGASQRATVARLQSLGATGPEIVTTVYNHAGVIETWTGGAIRPLHAWPLLTASGPRADCALRVAWAEILRSRQPRLVLLTEGPNLYESGSVDPPAIRRALTDVAAKMRLHVDVEPFATEASTHGWALAHVDYSEALTPLQGADEIADATCAIPSSAASVTELRGLRVGDDVGAFVVASIHPGHGAEPIAWIVARRGDLSAVFELRPDAETPPPPARGAGLAVYYRNVAGTSTDDLADAATGIAARLR